MADKQAHTSPEACQQTQDHLSLPTALNKTIKMYAQDKRHCVPWLVHWCPRLTEIQAHKKNTEESILAFNT